MSDIRHSTCAYCGVGCGITATLKDRDARLVAVAGDSGHPANLGRLCSKGSALGETLGTAARLLRPRVHGAEAFWNDALDTVAARLAQVLRESGPKAVAFYVSGQLLTEDYYVANKLAKGFVGTPHIDTNSRLCMASTVVAQQRAFGEDVVPGCYEDLELADLVILTGSNTAWCHPVLFQRLRAAREQRGTRIVVIDPRETTTCSIADLHLPVRAGTDAALFNGLLTWLADQHATDTAYIAQHTCDWDSALACARADAGTPAALAARCGISADSLLTFYRWFADTPRTVTCWSQGVNQSTGGTDKVNAIINCHLATGRIGKPGASPLSLTGQPNAMGGREVGGLATQLAAHHSIEDPAARDCVASFWGSNVLPSQRGLKAVDLFDAVAAGDIRFLWIIGTNPAASLPDAGRVRDAIAGCEFVVVSDCVDKNDTLSLAHVALPAQAWGEKDGTVTNSERCISRQRALLPAAGEARPDWWILAQVAQRLGHVRAFSWQHPGEIFCEHAALTALANPAGSGRQLDLGALAAISTADYDHLSPFQWPWRSGNTPQARLFGDGRFAHADGRARFIAAATHTPAHMPDRQFPFVLNTGRLRDQWHTMTRTGEVPRLNGHEPLPFVAVHPGDAQQLGLADGDLVQVSTAQGSALLLVRTSSGQQAGTLFAPMHWTRTLVTGGIVGALPNARVDPHSGQPELKHTPAQLQRVPCHARARVYSVTRPSLPEAGHAVLGRMRHGWQLDVFATSPPASLAGWLEALCPPPPGTMRQQVASRTGAAMVMTAQEQVEVVAVADSGPQLTAGSCRGIASAAQLFAGQTVDDSVRSALFSLLQETAPARMVCACLEVDQSTLRQAGRECHSVAALSAATRAGTRCGSCLPELALFVSAAGDSVHS